jgi:hypothetical protein
MTKTWQALNQITDLRRIATLSQAARRFNTFDVFVLCSGYAILKLAR